jgi:hypothetical protein
MALFRTCTTPTASDEAFHLPVLSGGACERGRSPWIIIATVCYQLETHHASTYVNTGTSGALSVAYRNSAAGSQIMSSIARVTASSCRMLPFFSRPILPSPPFLLYLCLYSTDSTLLMVIRHQARLAELRRHGYRLQYCTLERAIDRR